MNEQIRPHAEPPRPSSDPPGLLDANDPPLAPVTVSCGPYAERLPVADNTVGYIRNRFGDRFDIDPNAQALLDGRSVGDDVVVRPGQALMFIRRAGEKGR
jgi:hypothetical protein